MLVTDEGGLVMVDVSSLESGGSGPGPGFYAVRSFRLDVYDSGLRAFEERVTLWVARSHDDAFRLAAEQQSKEVAEQNTWGGHWSWDCGVYQSFALACELMPGMVVFSVLRESALSIPDYAERYIMDGREHATDVSDEDDDEVASGEDADSVDGGDRDPLAWADGLEWYGVKCLCLIESAGSRFFEERTTLWLAHSPVEAIALAEREHAGYVESKDSPQTGVTCVDGDVFSACQLFYLGVGSLWDTEIAWEVFSLIRDSEQSIPDYVERVAISGGEVVDEDHQLRRIEVVPEGQR